jgi:hypothetical protein
MFALADADTIVPLLTAAGFAEIEVEEMELRWRCDGPDELWTFASELQGPVALAIARLDWHERRQVRAALEERAAAFATSSATSSRDVHQRHCRLRASWREVRDVPEGRSHSRVLRRTRASRP